MAFVNEYISNEDIKKYELGKHYKLPWMVEGASWTIDRDSETYLLGLGSAYIDLDEGLSDEKVWVLEVNGVSVIFQAIFNTEYNSETGQKYIHWIIVKIDWPKELENKYTEIINILKEALRVYGYGGIYTTKPAPQAITLVFKD